MPPSDVEDGAGDASASASSSADSAAIPPKLVTRILHEFFQREETRITRDANGAVCEYLKIFVSEAIARAAGARDGRFLEVEDLETIAPQLLLDL